MLFRLRLALFLFCFAGMGLGWASETSAQAPEIGSEPAPAADEAETAATGSEPSGEQPSGEQPSEEPELRAPLAEPAWLETEAPQAAKPAAAPPPTKPQKKSEPPTSDPTLQQRWTAPQPVFSLDGYFRLRSEWQKQFYLGRRPIEGDEATGQDLPFSRYRPLEDSRIPDGGCGSSAEIDPTMRQPCRSRALSQANMRLRMTPTLALSDDVRVHMMVDVFDNLVLGSTPDTTSFVPTEAGLSRAAGSTAGSGLTSAAPPSAYNTSVQDSIVVRRAWAEVGRAGLGQLRFGRMGWQWGLGIFANDGAGIDGDFSTDVDRITALTEINDFHFALMYDFPNEGFIQQPQLDVLGLAYDPGNKDDLDQYALAVAYRKSPEEQELRLQQGKAVFNAGLQLIYRRQFLTSNGITDALADRQDVQDSQFFRRDMWAVTPDLWAQFRWKKLRIEWEAVINYGGVDDVNNTIALNRDYSIVQFGTALESEYRLLDDKLGIYFYAGYASGDRDVDGLSVYEDLETQRSNDDQISTFAFHRNYRIDLILWRNILGRVAGAYYFKPGVSYDFLRSKFGRLLGARADLIWSRASAPVQSYGSDADLGVELNASAYFRSEAGPSFLDGFYGLFMYGVLFPLAGLGYPSVAGQGVFPEGNPGLSRAQTVRLILGVQF